MIEFRNVTKRFGDKLILDSADLQLSVPGSAALIGMSGTGKTTLARMLLGLEKDYSGTIAGIPQKIGCVFQEDRLLKHLTAAENVRFVNPQVEEARLREGFARLGMENDMHTPAAALSGGMKRRVSILRALLSDAEMIVMDEPMKGLDEVTARAAAAYCREQLKGRTLLYITHATEEIEWMGIGRVLHLQNAKIKG